MLILYQSNALNELKNQLLFQMSNRIPVHPFEKETILVQSPGMAHWLKQNIASDQGVASGIEFPMPASFAWNLYQKFLSDVPDHSAFTKDSLAWHVMSLLPELVQQPDYQLLKHYLDQTIDQDESIACIRRYQLAQKIADTFDQYLVYRPDWIQQWEQGIVDFEMTHTQPWQPKLWNELVKRIKDTGQSLWHRGNLLSSLCQQLHQANPKTPFNHDQLPKVLYVFGVSTLPVMFLKLLHALSLHMEVIFFAYNPCQAYWFELNNEHNKSPSDLEALNFSNTFNTEIESNALLASMGKTGRDFFYQLNQLNPIEYDCFVEARSESDDHPSLLGRIQSHILTLTENVSFSETLNVDLDQRIACPASDRSVQVVNCHSALREVEVLHDYLLQLLDTQVDLTPKDIIIMTPDVQNYRALIEGVFSSVSIERSIPFSISDGNIRQEHPLIEAFMKLLTCNTLRCTAKEIMSFLEVPAIARCYQLTPEQLDTLKTWVCESGIRWGLNTEHQKRLSFPVNANNTWVFGLERILLGYAIDEPSKLYNNTLPFSQVSGLNAQFCGVLIEFVDAINHLMYQLENAQFIHEWIALIHQVLEDFFLADREEEGILNCIREALNDLEVQTSTVQFSEKLSHEVFVEWLNHYLDKQMSHQYFLNGKLTVSTLMPMRSIPFKVICLLGMNDTDYPRILPKSSFDLMSIKPRHGDRSRRDEDRYLFLEALLAAENFFYISYQGRSRRDNTIREPSVLVSELIAYCDRNFKETETQKPFSLEIQHPLQPFDLRYFEKSSQYFSYAKEWHLKSVCDHEIVFDHFMQKKISTSPSVQVVSVDELIRFYKNPAQYFFQVRLGFSFSSFNRTPDHHEPFTLDRLWKFICQQTLLDDWLIEEDVTLFKKEVISRIKAMGILPYNHFGRFDLLALWEMIDPLLNALNEYKANTPQSVNIELPLAHHILKGNISGCRDHRLLRYQPTKNKAKLVVQSLIEQVILCASDYPSQDAHVYCFKNSSELDKTIIPALSSQDSYQLLEKLITGYQKGLESPLTFLPNISHACLYEPISKTCPKKIQKMFEQEIKYNEYATLLWPEFNTVDWIDFYQCAQELLLPALINPTPSK